jgi:hypothetical protein
MLEQELIQTAINKLNQQTGLVINFHDYETGIADVEISLPGVKQRLMIKCKKWLNTANLQKYLGELALKNLLTDVVLVTDYINPNQATLLKEQKISFIDLAGNSYINKPPVYIDIQGKKPEKPHNEVALAKQLGKAFQPKGMKIVFMLLTKPELVNAPMRKIADIAEVALGTVKQVIDDLIYQDIIIQKGQRLKVLADKQGLLDKWLAAYPTNVEAKLNKEIYTTDNTDLLKNIAINDLKALWGGEYAAQLYDNYLNAKDYLIYVKPEYKNEVLKAARLRKAKVDEIQNGLITKVILADPPIAIEKIATPNTNWAHPLLIYANLMASNDPRNADAARRLYEKHIA